MVRTEKWKQLARGVESGTAADDEVQSFRLHDQVLEKLPAGFDTKPFLDAQLIHNLTDYLQALHEAGLANADHTTLLLNCYTKLKDVAKLDAFIMSADRDTALPFDVETAIRVTRHAGYHEHAQYCRLRSTVGSRQHRTDTFACHVLWAHLFRAAIFISSYPGCVSCGIPPPPPTLTPLPFTLDRTL